MEDRTYKVVENIKEACKGNNKGPVRVLIDPTDKCNLKCKFCWQRGEEIDYRQELSDERILKLVKEASELGVKEWIISGGGDPLTRPIIFKMMEKIKKYGMWGQVITNGLLLKEKDIANLAKIKWDHIQLSLDGSNSKTHDFLRNSDGAFKKIKHILKLFIKYKKKLGSDKPSIGFNSVLCRKNYKQSPKIIKIAKRYKVQQVWFEMISPWSESAKQYLMTKDYMDRFEKYAKKADHLARKNKIFTNIKYYTKKEPIEKKQKPNYNNPILSAYCLAPWFSVKIHPTGSVGPCCTFYRHESLGNLHKENLKDIWNKNFEILRKDMLKNKPPKYCKECTPGQLAETEEIKQRLSTQ